jgi:C-terminal processing protease CtpA/Prc
MRLTYAEKVVEGGGAALSGQVLQGDLLVAVDDVPVRGLALAQI